jgi:ubiquitin-like 1-activating enzyme E1 A
LINIRGLGNEIAKNLVLAGIGSLTILDSNNVTEDDLGAQFLISEEHIGMNVRPSQFVKTSVPNFYM